MFMHRGVATFTLDEGKCPRWLFERMVRLGRQMLEVIIAEEGPDEFIKRIGDPTWFQSLGTVLAFDWNASGLTTILTAALKEAIRGMEKDLGVFICGGKGKTSRKTPEEIKQWSERLGLSPGHSENLIYNSKMSAKIDSALVQDGYSIYHHSFFFSRSGAWTVVQQGMNTANQTARRYHWHSANIKDLVCEPHSGIVSQVKIPSLNLVAKASGATRELSVEMIGAGFWSLMKDVRLIRKYYSPLNKTVSLENNGQQLTLLELAPLEFKSHPVIAEDFSKSKYLEKILWIAAEQKPENYEKLLALKGVGAKTMRALALVGEVIYGANPSYEDPSRYSFAHGGKDATPYPVDRATYDNTIMMMNRYVQKMKIQQSEKNKIFKNLGVDILETNK